MINKTIIKAILNSATKKNKDKVLNELINHLSISYYNDDMLVHTLEMLADSNSIITRENVNIDYINKNTNILIYKSNIYNIRNIRIDSVDNIGCNIKITYEYSAKIDEDRDDVDYIPSYTNVNFIDNPDILKK